MREQDPMKRLPREFLERPATQVGPDLLGCVLWHDSPAGLVAARLVEVEAYEGQLDPASHAFRGPTARNAVMFGPAGHAYVYFSYGMHFCVNLVCDGRGHSSAVLIRAGAIVRGADLAWRRRYGLPDHDQDAGNEAGRGGGGGRLRGRELDLARGPGRLCQALGIDRSLNGADACGPGGPLGIGPPLAAEQVDAAATRVVCTGPRVGISRAADRPWRYWLADDGHVSVYRPAKPRAAGAKPVTGRDAEDGTMLR